MIIMRKLLQFIIKIIKWNKSQQFNLEPAMQNLTTKYYIFQCLFHGANCPPTDAVLCNLPCIAPFWLFFYYTYTAIARNILIHLNMSLNIQLYFIRVFGKCGVSFIKQYLGDHIFYTSSPESFGVFPQEPLFLPCSEQCSKVSVTLSSCMFANKRSLETVWLLHVPSQVLSNWRETYAVFTSTGVMSMYCIFLSLRHCCTGVDFVKPIHLNVHQLAQMDSVQTSSFFDQSVIICNLDVEISGYISKLVFKFKAKQL